MMPLPPRTLFRSAPLACACALLVSVLPAAARAQAPLPLELPPQGLDAPYAFAPPPARSLFTHGAEQPWTAPPLPPLPGADLWESYDRPCLGQKLHGGGLHGGALHGGAAVCRRHQQPLLTLVSGVLDGFFSLLTFPARKAAANRHGSPALRDCGCYPANGAPAIVPQPAPGPGLPLPPPNAVPRPRPPAPLPMTESAGTPLAPPADAGLPAAPAGPQVEPQRLYPGRAPVVELAPDPVLPPDQSQPPRNRIPAPSDRLPKNELPPR